MTKTKPTNPGPRERIMAQAAKLDRIFGDDVEVKQLIISAAHHAATNKELLGAAKDGLTQVEFARDLLAGMANAPDAVKAPVLAAITKLNAAIKNAEAP